MSDPGMLEAHPLRVLHLTAPAAFGGLESVVADLSTQLAARGHRVVLGAVVDPHRTEDALARRVTLAGVEARVIPIAHRAYWDEYRQLRRLIRETAPDIVHTHGYRSDLMGGLAARTAGRPWASTAHGFIGGGHFARLYEWLQVRSLRRAHAVLAVSEPIAARLRRQGVPPATVRVLPNARVARPDLPRDQARTELAIPDGAPVIGWVGRLTREKGADVFLDALARLQELPWVASLIGAGSEESMLRAQATRLGLGGRLHWHGLVPEAARYFRAFDVWVLSSRTEGTPIALLEAAEAMVPIVATAVGGVPAILSQREALLVPAEDPAALADALRETLTRPDAARERAHLAAARIRTERSPAEWVEAHLAVYRQVLERA